MGIAWAATTADHTVKVTVQTGVWHAIMSASFAVQVVILILLALSVWSWAIMLQKRKMFQAVEEANEPFEDAFWKSKSLEDIFDTLADHPDSALAAVFRAGYLELKKIADSSLNKNKSDAAPMLSGIDNLQRALNKAIDIEIENLESRLTFLATVGSVGPFIGLFGTVWGIMNAFDKIGSTGMANLAVVAPGISEALITTAIGLFAAIPASMGYNLYVTRLRKQEMQLNNFASDFLNIAKRNFFPGA